LRPEEASGLLHIASLLRKADSPGFSMLQMDVYDIGSVKVFIHGAQDIKRAVEAYKASSP
jgi:hypothetical protein